MANIVLKIQVNKGAVLPIEYETDSEINNVSTLKTVKTTENDGVNGISMATGYIELSNGFLGLGASLQSEVDKYNGYMFGAVDETGNMYHYSNGSKVTDYLILAIDGTSVKKIIITFDKKANQFARRAILDEGTDYQKIIYSDDPVWAIDFTNQSNTHTIKLMNWNRPYYNACFTTLQVMPEDIELDTNWINELSALSQATSDNSTIHYETVPNSGKTEIYDRDGELQDYITDGIIPSSQVPVRLYVNDKLAQSFITTDTSYDKQSNVMNISLSNNIKDYNNSIYTPDTTDANALKNYNGYKIFQILIKNTSPSLIKELTFARQLQYNELNVFSYEILTDYSFNNIDVAFKDKKASEIYEDFLKVLQLGFYKNNNNIDTYMFMRPIKPLDNNNISEFYTKEHLIYIPKPFIMEDSNTELVVKNKYKQVNINVLDTHSEKKYLSAMTKTSFTDSGDAISYTNERSFYKSEIFNEWVDFKERHPDFEEYLDRDIDPQRHWIIFTTEISNDYYIKLDEYVSGKKLLTTTYLKGEQLVITNNTTLSFTSIDLFKNFLHTYTPTIYCGFLNSPIHSNYINKYTIITAIDANLFDKSDSFQFWVTSSSYGDIGYSIIKPEYKTLTYYNPYTDISTIRQEEILTIDNNIFLTDSSTLLVSSPNGFVRMKLSDYIAYNILSDYQNGIRTKTVKIAFRELNYLLNGEQAVDPSQGSILDVGQYVALSDDRYSNDKIINWLITGRDIVYDGEPMFRLELMECLESSTLFPLKPLSIKDISWEQIDRISKTGLANYIFTLGDTKTIKVNGVNYTVRIIDFNRDVDENGNKVGITFACTDIIIQDNIIFTDYADNPTYSTSKVKSELETLYAGSSLETSLKNVIKKVVKEQAISGSLASPKYESTKERLFAFSYKELGEGSNPLTDNAYKYFAGKQNSVLGVGLDYWERDNFTLDNENSIALIHSGGTTLFTSIISTRKCFILFGFCV